MDGDGLFDGADRCPDVAEIYNDFEDRDGCPAAIADPDTKLAALADHGPNQNDNKQSRERGIQSGDHQHK